MVPFLYSVFDTFQYCSLNKRLLYVLCEGILELLFPDNKFNSIFHKIHAKPKVWWQLRWECFDITCCWCEKPAQALLMCYLSEKRCHRQERGVCREHVDSVDALWTLYPSLSYQRLGTSLLYFFISWRFIKGKANVISEQQEVPAQGYLYVFLFSFVHLWWCNT